MQVRCAKSDQGVGRVTACIIVPAADRALSGVRHVWPSDLAFAVLPRNRLSEPAGRSSIVQMTDGVHAVFTWFVR